MRKLVVLHRKPPRRKVCRARCLPRLEFLEDRKLPSTFTVVNTGDSGPGSLRQAVLDANASSGVNDIDFSLASYPGTITLSSQLTITNSLNLSGPGAANLTISESGSNRVFEVDAGSVSISGLSITGGNAGSANGGGILNHAALSLTDDTISGNSATLGGGIYSDGTLSVASSTLSANAAALDGGGIYTATTYSVAGMIAPATAGGASSAGGVTISSSSVAGNSAGRDGGGFLT
jgi:predicted outer membrane repeat protein